jgi:carboxyl-terminal processing protease
MERGRDRLQDPFRLPSGRDYDRPARYDFISRGRRDSSDGIERRYRVPVSDSSWGGSSFDRRDLDLRDLDWTRPGEDRFGAPGYDRPDSRWQSGIDERSRVPSSGLDPFTPAPLPRRDSSDQTSDIEKMLTARYQNPTVVRSVQSMTASQAVQLYREVSEQTDQRHLEPSTYDLRVRRAIRNLGVALDNPAFVQSLGVSADSFRMDGFRNSLARIYESMRVSNYSDAENVMKSVMQEAQSVPGLSANIVAFEFASATIDTLDKFSALEPSEPGRGAAIETESKTAGLESEIVGIGVEIKEHEDGLLIMKALRGGPAAEIGLTSGDIITAIDRRNIAGMPMATAIDMMKGSAGSSIQLRVVRDGYGAKDTTLVRRRVRVWTVNEMKILPGTDKVAYMDLSQFGQTSTEELDQALQHLYGQGMKSLIVDLRGNPGGLLNVCVDISNRFLPCGTIVSTKGRLNSDNMHEVATFDRTWDTPLVVLIDGDSASASEIFAAAVQDNRRGVVVGEKSYGKGTVQTHFPLSTINGNLRLTTARFYSPEGRAMSGQGVTPDVRVTDNDGPANGDQVLAEAVRIAQSRELKEMAVASGKCRKGASPLLRNSFKGNIYDSVKTRTVLR